MGLSSDVKRTLRRVVTRRHAVVLTYHSVLERPAPFSVWQYMDKDKLEEQFAVLVRNNHCISMSRLLAGINTGRVPDKSVVVTFDDGFANNLHIVLPLLEKYRIPATFFIATGFMDTDRLMWPEVVACVLAATQRHHFVFKGNDFKAGSNAEKTETYKLLARHMKQVPFTQLHAELSDLAQAAEVSESLLRRQDLAIQSRMMSWDELKRLAASELVEIGAHTVNHYRLSSLTDQEVAFEVRESKRMLEQQVGKISYFAYPYGGEQDYCRRHRDIAIEAGYTALFSSDASCVTAKTDSYDIPRVGIGCDATAVGLDHLVTGGLAMATGLRYGA